MTEPNFKTETDRLRGDAENHIRGILFWYRLPTRKQLTTLMDVIEDLLVSEDLDGIRPNWFNEIDAKAFPEER